MGGISRSLGDSLRERRELAGYSQRELAALLGWSTNARLSRYESGERTPSPDTLAEILDALDVKGAEREHLLGLVRRAGPGELVGGLPSSGRQLAQLLGYERDADRITVIAPLLVPGLLQTRDYARALIGKVPDLERRVEQRMERAEILTREHPVELWAIIHEEALTRLVAPTEVMRTQLKHLQARGRLPSVTLQLIPAGLERFLPSLSGPFMLIEGKGEILVHLEHHRSSVFLWDAADVRSYQAAVDTIARHAMDPDESAKTIAAIISRWETL